MRILIVEDNADFAQPLKKSLELYHYEAAVAGTVEQARREIEESRFDLILLDLELPDGGGLDLLRELRGREDPVPVIIISGLTELDDRVKGLDLGADDYLPKPFSFAELLARIRSLMRRAHGSAEPLVVHVDDLSIDFSTRRVQRGENELAFTQREYELLEYLVRARGRPVSRDELAEKVWKASPRSAGIYNLIDVHISKLRAKIDESFEKKLIHTVRGVGYALKKEDEPHDGTT